MKDLTFWKKHYIVHGNANEIERNIKTARFTSGNDSFELVSFQKDKGAPNILISPGSAGHSYVFAELAYEMHLKGFNVFIMPRQGDYTVSELIPRHTDALRFIANNFNNRIGVFAEGLGGYVMFYLALKDSSLIKSLAFQNAPGILTDKKFQEAYMGSAGVARRRKLIMPIAKILVKIFPSIKLPIRVYLDFKEMVDTKEENRIIEEPRIKAFLDDPDFDKSYSLRSVMSLVLTPPPVPLSALKVPTMFIVPLRGFGGSAYVKYARDLFNQLPIAKKKFIEVDDGVFWMCSHPKEAAETICGWFKETL